MSAAAGSKKTVPMNIVQANAPAVATTHTFTGALTRLMFFIGIAPLNVEIGEAALPALSR
jgi:hypothetical protein